MIPLQRPLLPSLEKIAPYLERIDSSRVYSNFGALNAEYCKRLGDMFDAHVITCSSATSALTLALMAMRLPKRSFIACPSWTFSATPASILSAGHIPFFFDVDDNGVIDTEWLYNKEGVAAMVVVAPFGAPIDIQACERIRVPVIIDAAAGFDSFSTLARPSHIPVVVSTHATKVFSTGEGGFIACEDTEFIERFRRLSNFGMTPERDVEQPGLNAKLSEYHAAVGLAELDGWVDKRAKWLQVQKWYGEDKSWVSSVYRMNVSGYSKEVCDKMNTLGIEARYGWYGVHRMKAYRYFPRTPMPNTEKLMDTSLFLPMACDMTQQEVERVLQCV